MEIEKHCGSLEEGWRAVGRVETTDCGRGRRPDLRVSAVRSLPRFFPRRAGRCSMSVGFQSRTWKDTPGHASPESLSRKSYEPEAPDRGDGENEAPEAKQEYQSEAPDAGEGRANWLEHEFTHGRSQS
jgi:hypothetical protein